MDKIQIQIKGLQKESIIVQAILYLEKLVNSENFPQGSHLPSLRYLKKVTGISIPSWFKALDILKANGVLRGGKGQRPIITCAELSVTFDFGKMKKSMTTGPLWKRIVQSIRRDMIQGLLKKKSGKLPGLKELQATYNVNYRTIKKALDFLAEQGDIQQDGKGYSLVSQAHSYQKQRIAFIVLSDRAGTMQLASLAEEFLRILELECSASHLRLDTYSYVLNDPVGRIYSVQDKSILDFKNPAIMGFIFLRVAPDPYFSWIYSHLKATQKPVAVLDVVGEGDAVRPGREGAVRNFTCATTLRCGEMLARYLLELGHRHIAFISPFHLAQWSLRRFEGMERIYSSAGPDCSATLCAFDRPPVVHTVYREKARVISDIDKFNAFYSDWKKNWPPEYVSTIDPLLGYELSEHMISTAEFRRRVSSLFSYALEKKKITAWASANDDTAIAALDFLHAKKINVPHNISLVSFDDTHQSLRRGLTSYNFNMRAYVHVMLGYLRNTRRMDSISSRIPYEIDGMVIERGTSAMWFK